MVIDALDTGCDGGEELIGDGTCGGGIALEEVAVAEDDRTVALVAVDIGDIDEAHVHADGSDNGGFVAADEDVPVAVAEAAMEAVGIAYGENGDAGGTRGLPAAVVADGVTGRDFLDLRDATNEAAYLPQPGLHLGFRGDAVEADAETNHVHLGLGESADATGVEDVPDAR